MQKKDLETGIPNVGKQAAFKKVAQPKILIHEMQQKNIQGCHYS
jgi:hypothetical protein